MYVVCMLYVCCCMYVVCMLYVLLLYVCCMYVVCSVVVCMLYVCWCCFSLGHCNFIELHIPLSVMLVNMSALGHSEK